MSQPATILIVDDDATVRNIISAKLQSRGYRTVIAPSGKKAISIINNKHVDLVLLDIHMPETSGNQVLQYARQKHSALELPVIMLTGSDETDAMVYAFQLGANDYILKPGNIDILTARIETQLSLKDMNTALQNKQKALREDLINSKVKTEMEKIEFRKEIESRVKAEEALIQSETRFKMLYDNAPAMCFILTLDGKILSANHYSTAVLGYSNDELVGMNILDLHYEEDKDLAETYLKVVSESDKSMHQWELRKRDKQGNPVYLRETAKLVSSILDKEVILLLGIDNGQDEPNI